MNVKELKEALKKYDDGNEVVIEVNGQAVPVVAHAVETLLG